MSRAQADDVLRYWLAALRFEEALQMRPAARPLSGGAVVPRLDEPSPGQEYFKVPLDASVGGLLSTSAELKRPFDAELCGFFEAWLHARYRRGDDDAELTHLLCFPVVHLPNGELAGLLRVGVQLCFGNEGSPPFRPPPRSARRRGAYPAPPSEARLTRVARPDGGWPFFVDTRLLHRTLAVPTDRIDALFEALRSLGGSVTEVQQLALVAALLETSEHDECGGESSSEQAQRLKAAADRECGDLGRCLERLQAALRRLLERRAARARAYGVGIVVDATRAKTTWHLQRELEALLDGDRPSWNVATPLGAYLTGQPLASAASPQRALFPGPPLSSSQRASAERFWGSRLTAVQGPPGTGKTRLILHLCAEVIVEQAAALVRGDSVRARLLLVTSSNNRAVDNVVDAFVTDQGLPLALRAGSRQVCEHRLAFQLRRTLDWLKRAELEPQSEREERLRGATRQFEALRRRVEERLAPRRAALSRDQTKERLKAELAQCEASDLHASIARVDLARAHAALLSLKPLEKRLKRLSRLCEAAPSEAAVKAVRDHYERTAKRQLRATTLAVAEASIALTLPLPPAPSETKALEQELADWEEAAENSLAEIDEIRSKLERAAEIHAVARRVQILRAELEALEQAPEPRREADDSKEHEEQAQQLFRAAVATREAWAAARADELSAAIAVALECVSRESSLRALFRDDAGAARLLCRLFGVWGSTLLSLGNCFPADLPGGLRVVIDEAGQCHPAHAVSALLRAESALVIGDVHQLSPVIELAVDDEQRLLRSCRLATRPAILGPYRLHSESTCSAQSLADRAVVSREKLIDHFRCQAPIIAISDALCGYGLITHTAAATRRSEASYLRTPLLLADLRGEQTRFGGSFCNEGELREALALVESLLQCGISPEDIAVITPYRGQLEQLRRGFLELRVPLEHSPELAESGGGQGQSGLALGTVHRFQGGERSIVVFSSVLTLEASLGFLNSRPNLLNVAVSRAKHHFICLGHAPILALGARSRLLVDGVARLEPSDYRQASELPFASSAESDLAFRAASRSL